MKTYIIILIITIIVVPLMSQQNDIKVQCDPETGLCVIPEFSAEAKPEARNEAEEIIYIGDPMCSWCWGISPELNALKRHAADQGVPFTIIMGGLRPGGGEEWNDQFKNFLKHHWEEVNKRSGQPFGYDIFEKENFNYDTEPACRAVVTARHIAPEKSLYFYEYVQHYFYVKSADPNQLEFYLPICETLDIDFAEFSQLFNSEEMKHATQQDFAQSRSWGISGFPSIVYRKDDQLHLIAQGYAEYEDLKTKISTVSQAQ